MCMKKVYIVRTDSALDTHAKGIQYPQNMCTMKEIVHRLDRFWAELTMVTLYRPDKLCARRKRIDREDFGLDTRR